MENREPVVPGLYGSIPTPEEVRQYIGDWVGDQWMKPDQPRTNNLTLRIRVENGRVIGETINPAAPPEMRVRRVEYLRVTPTGLTYGFMNGMRPRGMVLYEGTLRGDTLAGKWRFGGISFRNPAGRGPDPGFSLTRVRR